MEKRDVVVPESEFTDRYRERYGRTPVQPGYFDRILLRDVDVPLIVLERFLLTGRFNSMFDALMRNEGTQVRCMLQREVQEEMYDNFPFLDVHPDIKIKEKTRRESSGIVRNTVIIVGPQILSIERQSEVTGTVLANERMTQLELRLKKYKPQRPLRPPLEFQTPARR